MKCINCRWFMEEDVKGTGLCHRYPNPQEKSEYGWCGEYIKGFSVNRRESREKRKTRRIKERLQDNG